MINTTIKVVSSDGSRSSEEVIILQSAGAMEIDDDRVNHINSINLDNVQYAVKVTIDNVLDEIEQERSRRQKVRDEIQRTREEAGEEPEEGENADDSDVH